MFLCVTLPICTGLEKRLIALQTEFASKGIQFIGINANDSTKYPEDSFEEMKIALPP